MVLGDGNCWYHAVAITMFGASAGGLGHLVVRGLCVAMGLLAADHLKRLLQMETLGGDAEGAGAANFTANYAFDHLLWDFYRPGCYANRFSYYVPLFNQTETISALIHNFPLT